MGLLSEGIGDETGLAILPAKDKKFLDDKLKTVQTTGAVLAVAMVLLGGALVYNAAKR